VDEAIDGDGFRVQEIQQKFHKRTMDTVSVAVRRGIGDGIENHVIQWELSLRASRSSTAEFIGCPGGN
jgi:hypothetical protein